MIAYRSSGGPITIAHEKLCDLELFHQQAAAEIGYQTYDCNGGDNQTGMHIYIEMIHMNIHFYIEIIYMNIHFHFHIEIIYMNIHFHFIAI